MKNIILIAYQLNPFRGSECSVAWDYIVNMSDGNRITVIFGSSEEHHMIGNTKSMMDYVAHHPQPNVKYIPVGLDEEIEYKDYSAIGIWQFYRQYERWHYKVRTVVKEILSSESVDIIHYLGPIGYREPGFLYDLDVPYIWGPIGGFGGINLKLFKATGSFRGGLVLAVRKMADFIGQKTNVRVKRAINNSDVVIGATTEYTTIIKRYVKRGSRVVVEYTPENCIKTLYPVNEQKFQSSKLRLIWIGRPDSNKGLILLLEALSQLDNKDAVILEIVGSGVLEDKLKAWADCHGLSSCVHWNGKVDRERVFELINEAHLNVITSLYDANTTVIWEAMSMGVPAMALDHCGMHDVIKEDTGIKIPIHSYGQVCSDIAAALTRMINDPERRRVMAQRVVESRGQYTWENRKKFFERMYDLAITTHQSYGK